MSEWWFYQGGRLRASCTPGRARENHHGDSNLTTRRWCYAVSVPGAIFKARSCFSASPVAEASRRSTSNRPLKTEGTCFPSCEKGSTLSWDWPVPNGQCLIKGLGMSSRVYMRLGI